MGGVDPPTNASATVAVNDGTVDVANGSVSDKGGEHRTRFTELTVGDGNIDFQTSSSKNRSGVAKTQATSVSVHGGTVSINGASVGAPLPSAVSERLQRVGR